MKNFYLTLIFLLFSLFVSSQTTPTGSSSEVGITEGQLTVSLSGAANYTIPIKVPPGINGVVPQINLSYNSQSENGSVGYGWNIGGISTITRIPSTKYHNGDVGTIKYNLSDNYALDGQRLIVKNGTQGIYGRSGTEYETENYSNIKVTSFGVISSVSDIGPDYFVVEYPDGSKAYYGYITGNTSNSRGAIHYAITYWENAQGLRISYSYFDNYNNKLNIKKITYGAKNEATSINEINFLYENKSKQEVQLVGGQQLRDNLLLTQINTKSSGVGFRNYVMTYDFSSLGYERLKTITEKTGDNTKNLNPTVFSYVQNQPLVSSQIDWCGTSNFGVGGHSGDFDGDGDLEFISHNSYTGKLHLNKIMDDYSVVNLGTSQSGLLSTDNIPFVVKSLDSNLKISNKQNICVYTTDTPFTNQYFYKIFSYNKDTGTLDLDYQKTAPNGSRHFKWGDFNGDYLTDVISLGEKINGYYNVNFINLDRRLTTDFVSSAGSIEVGISANENSSGTITGTHVIQQGDINGDGKNDLIIFRGAPYNDITVYSLNKGVFEKIIDWPQNIPGDIGDTSTYSKVEFPVVLGDFNGDGKSDIFLVALGKILTSTGGNYFSEEFLPSSFVPPTYPYAPMERIVTMDFNNDGKDDILRIKPIIGPFLDHGNIVNGEAIEINYFYKGIESASPWLNYYYSRTLIPSPYGNYYPDPFTADDNYFTSNLNPLFVRKSKTNPNKVEFAIEGRTISFFSNNSFSTDQHLLKSVTLGNGVKEVISYSPLKNGNGVYESGSSQLYPNLSIQYSPEFKVVSQIDYPDNGQSKMLFKYYGAITNVEGLGFLGFQSTMRTNLHNDYAPLISNVSKNNFLLRGANTENYSIDGLAFPSVATPTTFITKSTLVYNSPQEALQSNKVFKLKNISSIQFDGLTNTSNETATDFDSYNNPVKVTTLVKDGASTIQTAVTDVVYPQPTVTPYIVGRPDSKIETVSYNGDVATNEEVYSYNSQQLLSKVKKRADATTSYVTEDNSYDTYGNITSKNITAGSDSRNASWSYDPSGRFLISKTDIESLSTTFTYYTNGTLKTETNPYGQTSTYEYDSWFRKVKTTDYLQKTITYSYSKDSGNNTTVLSAVSSDGTATTDVFNVLGNKIKEGVKANVNGLFTTKNNSYDIYGRLISDGVPYIPNLFNPYQIRQSETKYDTYGRVIQRVSPSQLVVNITYSGLTSTADDGSKTKKITKDAIGNVIEMEDNPGGIIKYSYYANGNLKQTDFGGTKTEVLQDKWGRKTQINDPSAGTFKYSYNDFNELIQEENSNGITNYKLSALGKLEEKTIVGTNTNSKTTYTYNSTTKLITSSTFLDIFNGDKTTINSYFYDNWKRLSKATETTPYATFTKILSYDDFGRINTETSVASSSGKSSSKTITKTYQNGSPYQILDGTAVLWQVDNVNDNGSIHGGTFGNGVKFEYSYDGDGYASRNELKVGTTSVFKLDTSFDVKKGNLKSRNINLFDYPQDFSYDNLDRLTNIKTARQFLFSTFSTSDIEGYETENGAVISTSEGSLSVRGTTAGSCVKKTLITGGSVGDEITVNFFMNRFRGTDSYNVYIEEQDPVSGASTKILKTTVSTSPIIIDVSHTVAQYGNIILRIEKVNTSAVNVFTLDNVIGKLETKSLQQYDAKGRITSNNNGTYKYPTSGKIYQNSSLDLTTKNLLYYQNKPQQVITYNAFNSPYQIEDVGIEKVSFNYNDDDNRSTMFYGGLQDKLLRPYWKHFSGDGTMEIKENKTTGEVEFITYIGGDGYSAPVVFKSDGVSNQNYLYLHRDYQSSILAITNQAGSIVEKRLFDPWGEIIKVEDGAGNALTGLTILDRGYTGHEHLQSVGIINMNGRLYDPNLHRFLQPDNNIQNPFNTQNYNRYGYVLNNPLKYTDPSGEFWNVIFGYLFTAYVSGAYASGGELNPAKWNSNALVNVAAKGASFGASTVATNFTNNYLDNYNNPPELGISSVNGGGKPLGIIQNGNNWLENNIITTSPNWSPIFYPWDARGYEIFSHWIYGSGTDLSRVEGNWGSYMRANEKINDKLRVAADEMALHMKLTKNSTYAYASGNSPMEIEDGYFSGYGLLHGTEYFSYAGIGKYNNKTDTYSFNFSVKWFDQINKNSNSGDDVYADPLMVMGAKDYYISIKWRQSISLKGEDVRDDKMNTGVTTQSGRRGFRR